LRFYQFEGTADNDRLAVRDAFLKIGVLSQYFSFLGVESIDFCENACYFGLFMIGRGCLSGVEEIEVFGLPVHERIISANFISSFIA